MTNRIPFHIPIQINPTRLPDRIAADPARGDRIIDPVVGQVQAALGVVEQARVAVVGVDAVGFAHPGGIAVGIVVVGREHCAARIDQIAHRAQVVLGVVVGRGAAEVTSCSPSL